MACFLRAVYLLLGGLAHEERARLRRQPAVVLARLNERIAQRRLTIRRGAGA